MTGWEKTILIILGPTGVGKTGASLKVAQTLGTEIISADSMQIYRLMDIGTAKPSIEERRLIRHHMIDRVDPSEHYSTGRYIEDVVPIIERLHKQKKVPLFVGGTGLYIKAMTRGLFAAPEADPDLREELLTMEREQKGCLYERLRNVDPRAVEKITPRDTRRIIRALEVYIKGDMPISEMQEAGTIPLPYEYIKIGLTRDRGELYAMIEERVDRMFLAGLIEEVKSLLQKNPKQVAMQAIGYKEVERYLRGEIDRDEMIWSVKRATKRYAKRQYTWFRKEPGIDWIDISGIHDAETIGSMVLERYRYDRTMT